MEALLGHSGILACRQSSNVTSTSEDDRRRCYTKFANGAPVYSQLEAGRLLDRTIGELGAVCDAGDIVGY